MRIAVVSHSLIAPRQSLFFDHMDGLDGVRVLQIGPKKWGPLTSERGFGLANEGYNNRFVFGAEALEALRRFRPDILYVQEELYSACAHQATVWAKQLKARLVFFVWNNQIPAREDWAKADMILAGNSEAARIHEAAAVIPQVGVDPEIFYIADGARPYNMLFASAKRTREKGFDLYAKLPFGNRMQSGNLLYESMGALYRQSKVVVTPSRDTPQWKEQFSPFCNVEALLSGCSVVASDSAAMVEWLAGGPGIVFFRMGNYDGLEHAVGVSIKNWTLNREGRNWAIEKFGTEAVARRLATKLSEVLA